MIRFQQFWNYLFPHQTRTQEIRRFSEALARRQFPKRIGAGRWRLYPTVVVLLDQDELDQAPGGWRLRFPNILVHEIAELSG
jgi:hypothetical protein